MRISAIRIAIVRAYVKLRKHKPAMMGTEIADKLSLYALFFCELGTMIWIL